MGVPSPDYFGGGSVNKVYIGGIEYANNTNNAVAPSRIQTEEGFVGLRENWTESSLLTKYVYYYTLKDHLGNIRIVMNDDQDAELVQSNSYSAFGLLALGPNAGALKYNSRFYNGKEKQEDTGWLDYGARMYIPESGRWLTVDPSHEDGGQESTSPYGYVFNDPIKHTDPDGKLPTVVVGAILGAVVAGTVAAIEGKSGKEIAKAAVGGAISGAIIGSGVGLIASLGLTTSVAGTVSISAGAGLLAGGAESTFSQGVDVANGTQKKINTGTVVRSAAVGMVANVVGAGIGAKLEKPLAKVTASVSNYVSSKLTSKVALQSVSESVGKKSGEVVKKVVEGVSDAAQGKVADKAKDKLKKE